MLEPAFLCAIAPSLSGFFGGTTLHRAALKALDRGAYAVAAGLFDCAARRYRRELAVERLARLRAHQAMAAVLSSRRPEIETERLIEVERLLTRLGWIEELEPPFTLVEARTLLADWLR